MLLLLFGDYKDTNFIFSIKAMYPNIFKWISIYTIDSIINENLTSPFDYIDYAFVTSEFGYSNLSRISNVPCSFLPYGPNIDVFYQENDRQYDKENIRFLCSARNVQSSNLGAFIKASKDFDSHLHTNYYDVGDYNIDVLKERYNKNLKITEKYTSVKEGLTDEEMRRMYNDHDFIVDTSVKSATRIICFRGNGMSDVFLLE